MVVCPRFTEPGETADMFFLYGQSVGAEEALGRIKSDQKEAKY